jgi:hypothetical protein
MRFRPANISLINRRLYLPRLLLTLSSERQKTTQRFADVDRVTPYQLTVYRSTRSDIRMGSLGHEEVGITPNGQFALHSSS